MPMKNRRIARPAIAVQLCRTRSQTSWNRRQATVSRALVGDSTPIPAMASVVPVVLTYAILILGSSRRRMKSETRFATTTATPPTTMMNWSRGKSSSLIASIVR